MTVITEYTSMIVMLLLLFFGVLMYKFVEWIGTLVEMASERARARTLENDKLALENKTIELENTFLELKNEKLALDLESARPLL